MLKSRFREFKIVKWIIGFFINHPWLKIISLLLAIIIWFYIRNTIDAFNW